MGDNATAAIVAVSLFGALASLAVSIKAITRAWVERGRDEITMANQATAPLADARLARLEQAVNTIAIEVERMSEAQRYTTKLLNERVLAETRPAQKQLDR
jgi:hypothetical protein